MNQEIQDLRTEVRQWEERRDDAQNRRNDLRDQGKTRNADLGRLRTNLEGLQTQSGQQEGRLESNLKRHFQGLEMDSGQPRPF